MSIEISSFVNASEGIALNCSFEKQRDPVTEIENDKSELMWQTSPQKEQNPSCSDAGRFAIQMTLFCVDSKKQ
jgi:hypothetical protein